MTRKQDENLRPSEYKLSRDEAKKGGKRSGEVRRAKKTMREYTESLLSSIVADKALLRKLGRKGFDPNKRGGYTFYEAIIIGQIASAMNGDARSYNAIKETVEPKTNGIGANVEDLSPLADLLRIENKGENDDE